MPSRNRDLKDKEYYHLYNRGFKKQILFHNRQDFKRFYETIIRYNKIYKEIKIVSYSFLPNHFHFIVHSESGLQISNFMRKIQQAYTMYYRAKYKELSPDSYNLSGPLFEGRFKAKLIDTDEYLKHCIAYVNFNPLKHEIVKNIEEYPWTSFHQIENKRDIMGYKDLILSELEY